jgi:antitoxin PrlF
MSDKTPPEAGKISEAGSSPFRIEAVLSVDSRGQLVIPKEIRVRAHIADGDKLALVSWENDGNICCLSLVKTDKLSSEVEDILRPIMTGIQ